VIDPDFLIEAQKVILDPKRILAQKEVQEYCSTAVLDRKLLDKLCSKAKIDEKLRETVIEFLIEDAFLYRLSHDKFLVPGLLPAVKDRQLEVKAPYPCRGMYVYDAEEKNYVNDEGAVMQLGEDGWDIVFATEVKHHLSKASFPPTGSWKDCTVQLGKHSGRLEALHFLNNNPPRRTQFICTLVASGRPIFFRHLSGNYFNTRRLCDQWMGWRRRSSNHACAGMGWNWRS